MFNNQEPMVTFCTSGVVCATIMHSPPFQEQMHLQTGYFLIPEAHGEWHDALGWLLNNLLIMGLSSEHKHAVQR